MEKLLEDIVGWALAFVASPFLYAITLTKRFDEEQVSISFLIRIIDWFFVNGAVAFLCISLASNNGSFLIFYAISFLLLMAGHSLLKYEPTADYLIRLRAALSFMATSWIQTATIAMLSPLSLLVLFPFVFVAAYLASLTSIEGLPDAFISPLIITIVVNSFLTIARIHFGKDKDAISFQIKNIFAMIVIGTLILWLPSYYDWSSKNIYPQILAIPATIFIWVKWINGLRLLPFSSPEECEKYKIMSTLYQIILFLTIPFSLLLIIETFKMLIDLL